MTKRKPLRPLTSQDKLALMMTGARSQRGLAEYLGISHQKLGRWLREGQDGGVKRIPDDMLTSRGIDAAFGAFVEVAEDRARVDNLPFDRQLPVFLYRKPLRSGAPGDRVFAEHTHHMSRTLRHETLISLHQSNRFYAVSVRSTIELAVYFKQAEKGEGYRRGKIRTPSQSEARRHLANALSLGIELFPIYTKREDMRSPYVAESIERQLRQKHEPATSEKGTALADALIFQLKPANYVESTPKAKRRAKRVSKRAK